MAQGAWQACLKLAPSDAATHTAPDRPAAGRGSAPQRHERRRAKSLVVIRLGPTRRRMQELGQRWPSTSMPSQPALIQTLGGSIQAMDHRPPWFHTSPRVFTNCLGADDPIYSIIAPVGQAKAFFFSHCRQCGRHLSPGQVRTHATRCRSCEKKGPAPRLERPVTTHCILCQKALSPSRIKWRERKCVACTTGKGIIRSCELCAWRGFCHKHRIVPGSQGGKYVPENIKRLCPNCHAAQHGQGEANQQQYY